ncbi:EAL and HDOD domain-containing protein [Kineobactrum salinum]|uniref:HDOD domain-containing protein n=1 Tax=Kineobactrum salinum TaxID=2708301 RepID=A0A6C0U1V9_9GAMM|nr:HDOD domain-containing protein [Kineobactrum salinum]QIB64345.1 HDOD domain-containing protein [Kineobactrum salinum]
MIDVQELANTPPLDILLSCQPVYTRNQDVAAFYLMLQHTDADGMIAMSDIQALVPVVLENYAKLFQHGKIGPVPCIIRITPQILFDSALLELPRKQLILEISEAESLPPGELTRHLQQLSANGHRLALDCSTLNIADADQLLGTVHIARLDLDRLNSDELQRALKRLKRGGIDILAHNICDEAQFRDCVEQGFTYYHGPFLGKPTPVQGRKIGGNKVLLLQLLAKLQDPDATVTSLEAIAIRDATLTYRLLRIVNAAALGFRRKVDTLSEAITLLGTEEIKRWVNLFLVENEPGKPGELTRNMLVRARMCEILAQLGNQPNPVNYFIVGLLSQLDVLMDISMPDLMEQVPLGPEVKLALLQRAGSQGETLAEVERYEQGRFDELQDLYNKAYYEVAYRHASAWARQVEFELHG